MTHPMFDPIDLIDVRSLPCPATYFPIERAVYEVGPGLKAFGTDFGNGALDKKVFQVDSDVHSYLAQKQTARSERLSKYFGVERLSSEVRKAVVFRLASLATNESPDIFNLRSLPRDEFVFESRLTGDQLKIAATGELILCESPGSLASPYGDSLDALVSQFQEDAAIVTSDGSGNWVSMVHVTGPSHWAPGEKLGRDFATVHAPVPGFERMARMSHALVDAMIHKGPFVRFVWSFVTDDRLNHHPEAPDGEDITNWRGRSFDPSKPEPFSLRVERQLTLGLPEVSSAVFIIRLSFVPGSMIRQNPDWRAQLIGALMSMSPEARKYKGIDLCFDSLLEWLNA